MKPIPRVYEEEDSQPDGVKTVPPPPNGDAYSAATRVGAVPASILADLADLAAMLDGEALGSGVRPLSARTSDEPSSVEIEALWDAAEERVEQTAPLDAPWATSKTAGPAPVLSTSPSEESLRGIVPSSSLVASAPSTKSVVLTTGHDTHAGPQTQGHHAASVSNSIAENRKADSAGASGTANGGALARPWNDRQFLRLVLVAACVAAVGVLAIVAYVVFRFG